jgi:SAM-dependent methyltransferase
MNTPPSSNPTVAYYDRNAVEYSGDTEAVDMSHLYGEFLPYIPEGGSILDAGCGSGRDASAFKRQGYVVTAFDASRELAFIASQALGDPVEVMGFLDLEAVSEFDGIWGCASLLHVPSCEMDEVLRRITRALKPGAVLYASFKYGSIEGYRGERFFNDYNEEKLGSLLGRHPSLSLLKQWTTTDSRPGRGGEFWLNAIVKNWSD